LKEKQLIISNIGFQWRNTGIT